MVKAAIISQTIILIKSLRCFTVLSSFLSVVKEYCKIIQLSIIMKAKHIVIM